MKHGLQDLKTLASGKRLPDLQHFFDLGCTCFRLGIEFTNNPCTGSARSSWSKGWTVARDRWTSLMRRNCKPGCRIWEGL